MELLYVVAILMTVHKLDRCQVRRPRGQSVKKLRFQDQHVELGMLP